MRRRSHSPLVALFLIVGLSASAAAQGNGGGNGRPKGPKTTTPAPAPAPAPAPSPAPTSGTGTTTGAASPSATPSAPATADASIAPTAGTLVPAVGFRQFGSWLDDASAPIRGQGYTTIGIGHWRMSGVTQTNMPMFGVGVGVSDRLQMGASVPFYRVQYADGSASGLDDVYLSAKYNLIDPTLTVSEMGLSITPVVEMLSAGAPDGRIHFALPVSVELRRQPFRVYGSAGYFTRGAFFTGGALEWTAPSNLTITGSLTQSYSLPQNALLDSMAIGRQRVDVSGSVAYPVGTRAVAYASAGRSLSSIAQGGTSLALSGGVSLRFSTTP